MYTEEEKKHFRVWGEFYNYPECCIDWFVNVPYYKRPEGYTDDCASTTAGFLMCPACKATHKTKEDVINLLGRNPFRPDDAPVGTYESITRCCIEMINTPKYKDIASKHNYDYTIYLLDLENGLKKRELK